MKPGGACLGLSERRSGSGSWSIRTMVEAVRGGEGAELLGSRGLFLLRVIVSSLWRVPIEPGISGSLAIVIASLKEGKGPFPKEDWSGSLTAMRWRSPFGLIWAMVCVLGPATEAVEAMSPALGTG